MLFPALCIDNFFSDPDKVVELSKIYEYSYHPNGKWPGTRTQSLHIINPKFHFQVGKKILATLFPNTYEKIGYSSSELMFQKITPGEQNIYGGNWVHCDSPMDLTFIVYLSNHKNAGTSIYEMNKPYPNNDGLEKNRYTFSNSKNKQKAINLLEQNNKNFTETISFKSKYNRAIFFDSGHWHSANISFDKNEKNDRLTLIGFYRNFLNTKFHVVENNRI